MTLGGASVGDHDLVKSALAKEGMELGFWRIAMRPGKPLIHGRLGDMLILGLPGNPVSAIVCGVLFLLPLVRALCGEILPGRRWASPRSSARRCAPMTPARIFCARRSPSMRRGLPVATPFAAAGFLACCA